MTYVRYIVFGVPIQAVGHGMQNIVAYSQHECTGWCTLQGSFKQSGFLAAGGRADCISTQWSFLKEYPQYASQLYICTSI